MSQLSARSYLGSSCPCHSSCPGVLLPQGGSQDTGDLKATVVIMSWNMIYNSSSIKEANEVRAGNPTLSEVSTLKPINANLYVYNIDTSKLKSQVGPKSGWRLPFEQFYGSLSTPLEADYTSYVLLIIESFLPETKQLFTLTRGWNKLPQTNVPSEHMQTQNSVSHLFIDAFFCSPRIITFCWMLSLNRLAQLFSWEGLWQAKRQDFSHVLQQNVSIFV